ncbi:MAG: helix-turn-helix domain-containing protein [Chloroflexi bacterium]|nr:helix-turn-helix domain-containing protein [Chloroflexota bacterium]
MRRCRVAAGLTQEALAHKAGLSARGLSDLERGLRHSPHPDTVRRLADALGLQREEQAVLAALAVLSHMAPTPATTGGGLVPTGQPTDGGPPKETTPATAAARASGFRSNSPVLLVGNRSSLSSLT